MTHIETAITVKMKTVDTAPESSLVLPRFALLRRATVIFLAVSRKRVQGCHARLCSVEAVVRAVAGGAA